MNRWLRIYLQNHEAAARGGAALFRRAARAQRRRPYGAELADLDGAVQADLRSLRRLMGELGVAPNPVMGTAVVVGERLGRSKPNGRLVRRSPLSDLVEIEAGRDAVFAKRGGWQALRVTRVQPRSIDLDELVDRADDQLERLTALHIEISARVLGPSMRSHPSTGSGGPSAEGR